MEILACLIVGLPLLGALLCARLRNRLPGKAVGAIATACVALPFLLSLEVLTRLLAMAGSRTVQVTITGWIVSGSVNAPLAFLIDPLSVTWMLIITGVGSLIHLYSIGYMHGEEGEGRFFAYLNLFVFAMLVLVMANNLVLMFLGWEGVGLCSYLLIGFHFDKDFAADAGRKAFIVNRIGDAGFLLGMFAIFAQFGTIEFTSLEHSLLAVTKVAPLIPVLLFVGAMGKSAQLPLYVWLPDAMAGPTPVSALIHAATMVTGGIYMVARLNLLFSLSESAMLFVACIGAATALLAATIGLAQRDIKKVLAYSTVSQLGYMFLGLGVGGFSASVFHVTTHAFFKALLFLAAGSVIHALAGEQDIMKMGGLRKKIPLTFSTFVVGAIALSGLPPCAGFFSKDEILSQAFSSGHYVLFAIGIVTAAITATYTFRLLLLVFFGESRMAHAAEHHVHESPGTMTGPLVALAIASAFGGLLAARLLHSEPLTEFLAPVFEHAAKLSGSHASTAAPEILATALSVAAALSGLLLALAIYRRGTARAALLAQRYQGAHQLLENKYFVDEAYDQTIVGPLRSLSRFCARFDLGFIDGMVNGIATLSSGISTLVRILQSGTVHTYVFWFLVGAVTLVTLFV